MTLDYGPFGFMERFQPMWNPWVGGGVPYAFGRQPQAAATNLVILAETFVRLIEHLGKESCMPCGSYAGSTAAAVDAVRRAVSDGFTAKFNALHDDNCRRKLGLAAWDDTADELWGQLFTLMSRSSRTDRSEPR